MKRILKCLLSIVLGIIVLFGVAMGVFMSFVNYNNSEKENKIEVLKPKTNVTDKYNKALIIYQPSRVTDVTKNMANEIAKGLNSDGYEVKLMYPGKKTSSDISQYKVVVFGSPIYIGQISSVTKDYIKRIKDFRGKKIGIFTTGDNDDSE